MRSNGWDESTATARLGKLWPDLDLWNRSFTDELRNGG